MFQLLLEDISLDVKLGHSEQERSALQQVFVQIKFQFETMPLSCTTDDLQDTLCYASLVEKLQRFCDDRVFKLIEGLAYQLHQFVKAEIIAIYSGKIAVFLQVNKNPPLSTLKKASFSVSDSG